MLKSSQTADILNEVNSDLKAQERIQVFQVKAEAGKEDWEGKKKFMPIKCSEK